MSIYANYEEHLHGPYSESLVGFIKRNQALGFKFKTQIWALVKFDAFTINTPDLSGDALNEDVVVKWVNESWLSNDQMRRRAILMHQFGEYIIGCGKVAYLYPKRRYKAPARYIPYIFTSDQITMMIERADMDAAKHPNVRSRVDTAVILRILYGCGLRISEVMGLKVRDVDLENEVLRIWQSKFQKDRLVPVSSSLLTVCRSYRETHLQKALPDDCFFTSDGKRPYSEQTIYNRFRDLIFDCGIPHRGKGFGPRLHDLRHTFAVHSLRQLAENGNDLYVSLPILSTFLGHSSVSATQWYLRLTSEIFPDMMAMVEKRFGDVYPEVHYEQKTY